MTPILCDKCFTQIRGGNFCPSCGQRLGSAQRSTGKLRILADDPIALAAEAKTLFAALRAKVNAPESLLAEGRILEGRIARWVVSDKEDQKATFSRFLVWVREVNGFLA